MNVLELYNLTAEMKAVLDALGESGGELTPEVEARLNEIDLEGEALVEEYALAARTMAGAAQWLERDEFRLRDRKAMFRRSERTLRDAIVDRMVATGIKSIKRAGVTVSLVEGDVKPIWDGKDENIPEPYRRTLVEYKLDEDRVLRDRADGVEFPADMRFRPRRYCVVR